MGTESTLTPVLYRMTYILEGYGRKSHVTVFAVDAMDAIKTANSIMEHAGRLVSIETKSPRWIDSDATVSPDGISEAALRHFSEKMGFELLATNRGDA